MQLNLLSILMDTLLDALKMLPFLFVTYLALEFLENKASAKTTEVIQRSGRFGPVIGAFLGALPQCGFSVAASNFYAGRVITLGTLISIFLSTSDEMLPIFIAESISVGIILKILILKVLIGMVIGLLIDGLYHLLKPSDSHAFHIDELCEQEHCHCETSLLKPALHHTLRTLFFILLVTLAINLVIGIIGEDALASVILNRPIIGNLLSGIVGLIPNCAGSVVITQLYLSGAMSSGAMMSGLLVSAGVGLLVLYRMNKNVKQNLTITGILYFSGVVVGILLDLFQITI